MIKIDLNYLINIILNENPSFLNRGDNKKPFDIGPKEFLKFAKEDFKKNTQRNLVNALGNIKRSIDSQIDTILFFIGYYNESKGTKETKWWDFPKKINFLQSKGIISPNILKKINKIRVKLEHHYKSPVKKDVEEAIDIAELFIDATEKYACKYDSIHYDLSMDKNFPRDFKLTNGDIVTDDQLEVHFIPEECKFKLSRFTNKGLFVIEKSHPEFEKIFRRYLYLIKINAFAV